MEKRILSAVNGFKEVLSSVEINAVLESNLRTLLPNEYEIVQFPLSDGGDGFLDSLKMKFATRSLTYQINFPYDSTEKLDVVVELDTSKKRLFIESAKVLGLNLVEEEKRNPLELTSRGLGELLRQIKEQTESGEVNVDEVIIGLGGSATQDLGLGALSVFGVRLFHFAKYIPVEPKFYSRADRISYNKRDLEFPFRITFVLDVKNPLIGENGSNKTFAEQKGADSFTVDVLERGFKNILRLLHVKSADNLPGAAGGIAAGFMLLVEKTNVIDSEKFISEILGLNEITDVGFVITGEGKLDSTTLNGKAPYIVLKKFKDKSVKRFFVTGKSEINLPEGNIEIISLSELLGSEEKAKIYCKKGLEEASRKIAKIILEK